MTIGQRLKVFVGVVAVAMFFGAEVHATVLTFDGNICSGGNPCIDFAALDQTYGDIAGQLDVVYAHRVSGGNAASDEAFLKSWGTAYSDLLNVAWGGFGRNSGVSEIALIPNAGFQVTLNGFDLGAWPNTDRGSQYSIYDSAYTLLASSGAITIDGTVHSHFPFSLTNASGLIVQWGPDAYDVGIDNVDFTVQRVTASVPEPTTGFLLSSGLLMMLPRKRNVQ